MDAIASFLVQALPWILPIAIPLVLFQILPLIVLIERRGAGFIQDRAGPNRAGIVIPGLGVKLRAFGMIYNITDLLKGIAKESFIPPFVHKGWYLVAPIIPVCIGLMTPAVIPWFAPFAHQTATGISEVQGTILTTDNGLLVLFALGSLSVYGVVLAAWSSNSKFSLLGGIRASAMMISYEVSMGLGVLGMLLLVGSFSLTDAVTWQGAHTWGVVVQPVGFVLFLIAMFAETCRNPFDVTEGESEIVGGYHTEYNGIRFMLFMTGEYLHVLIASVLIATLFFGGYHLLPCPLPVGSGGAWIDLDSTWVRGHLPLVGGIMFAVTGVLLLGFAKLIAGRRAKYARGEASDRASRLKEYALYASAFAGLGLALLIGGIALPFLIAAPQPITGTVYSDTVNLLTALVQFHILLGKAMLFVWLFVWVRWTLPRFRYDQIMGLGWKVLLNVALVNLLITALIATLIKG